MTKTLEEMKNADVFDSRDVIERLAEIEADAFAFDGATEDNTVLDILTIMAEDDESGEGADMLDEYKKLSAFAEEASGYAPDWQYGEIIISDDYFEDYARELADDIGAVKDDAGWPTSFIDWEKAAEALQQDYSEITLDGVVFWVR